MNRDEIITRLRTIVRDASVVAVDWQAINADTTIESLGFDSLSILDLLYDLEQEFDVALEPGEVMEITTVGGVADLLVARRAAS